MLVAPDGGLNFLSFGALADPAKPGGFLVERYAFGTVGSARYLVEMPRAAAGSEVESLLAVGGVDYESSVSSQNSPPPPGFPGPNVTVDPLPGTRAEVQAVCGLFDRLTHGQSEQITGREASKEHLRTRLPGHRYLHLATHGYFEPPRARSAQVSADPQTPRKAPGSMGGRIVPKGLGPQMPGPRPGWSGFFQFEPLTSLAGAGPVRLLRCRSSHNRPPHRGRHLVPGPALGLVCAAPIPAASLVPLLDVGTGVLTAEEVAGLDLSGCRLAVLSACRTGLGNVAGGQGVLGLQRAFHRAGVATVVASLSDVDDVTTTLLMDQFYANLWEKKLPILGGLRQRSSRCWITRMDTAARTGTAGCGPPWPGSKTGTLPVTGESRRRSPRHGGPGLCSAAVSTDQPRGKSVTPTGVGTDEPGFKVAARIGLAGS